MCALYFFVHPPPSFLSLFFLSTLLSILSPFSPLPDNLWSPPLLPAALYCLASHPLPPLPPPSSSLLSPLLLPRRPSPPAAPLTWEKCFSLIFTSTSTSLCLWAVSSRSLLSASSRLLRSSSNICRRACTSLSWERRERRQRNRWRGERRKIAVGGGGQYVNLRQILQYKVNDCQKRLVRIQVPIQGFVKYIP